MEKKKQAEMERLEKRRAEAQEELELIQTTVGGIIRTEEDKGGLLIVKALYGRLHLEGSR